LLTLACPLVSPHQISSVVSDPAWPIRVFLAVHGLRLAWLKLICFFIGFLLDSLRLSVDVWCVLFQPLAIFPVFDLDVVSPRLGETAAFAKSAGLADIHSALCVLVRTFANE
jgi:hypothetical protein